LFIHPRNHENGAATCSPSGETLDLARELFDGEKFQQYFGLTREAKILPNCSGNTCP